MTAPTPAGTQRRIRALFALGWFDTSIEAATGVPADKMRRARLDRQSIRPDLAASVVGAYEALWNREPPRQTAEQQGEANAARAYARRWGWAPPMGWDDDLIDDPAYRPPAREWKRTGERHVSALAIAEDVAFVREHGGYSHATDSELALRLGVSKERLEKALERSAVPQQNSRDPGRTRTRSELEEHAMTSVTTTTTAPMTAPTIRRTLADWLARKQDGLSTRVHAAGDAAMAQAGLTVTASTGRFGFGARTYRHPGFGSRH